MAKKLYHLYEVKPEDVPEEEPYYIITTKRTLLYTNRKAPEQSRKISDLSSLSELEKSWLNDTINQMRLKHLRQNEREILRRGKKFAECFEAELRAEKEKLEQERVTKRAESGA